ncbi:MAG: carboxypeptidase-like regulatory domain-containing protein [Planctomycetaceae bacterium]|jgi:hypothetical protein|nr:carboxypeptidase-like regulatory domain-containing protein [Planctomycetaceae bacterium]
MKRLLILLLYIIIFAGCRQERTPPDGLPNLYPCTIFITQEGKPVEYATVTLHSSPPLPWTVNGKTAADGTATVFTHGYFNGAPLGQYKVTVRKIKTVAPPMPEVLPKSEAALSKLYDKIEAETKDYDLIDPQFGNENTTPLEITVEKRMPKTTFDVGKSVTILTQ